MSLKELFEQACPYYMAYGMTYHQFWDGDVCAHKSYLRAYKIKQIERNTDAWLHGRYVYDALCAVSPILRAFSKARQPKSYTKEPYDLFEEQRKRREEEERKAKYEHIKEKVAAFAAAFNEQRNSDRKEGVDNGSS